MFVVILGIALSIFWFKIAKEKVKGFRKEEFNFPGFDREFLEIPEFGNEEKFKKIEELIREEAGKQESEIESGI